MGKGTQMWARYAVAEMALAMANGERMEATRALTAAQDNWEQAEWSVKLALAELEASRTAIVEAIDAAEKLSAVVPQPATVDSWVDSWVDSKVDSWSDEACVGDQLPGRSATTAEPVMATAGPVDVDANGRSTSPDLPFATTLVPDERVKCASPTWNGRWA